MAIITRARILSVDETHLPGPDELMAKYWEGRPKPDRTLPATPVALAFVEHGRWLVRCPFCPSAQIASRTKRRFFCVECGHVAQEDHPSWLAVQWPTQWERIEQLLGRRPDRMSRNWVVGEPVERLEAENAAHNVL